MKSTKQSRIRGNLIKQIFNILLIILLLLFIGQNLEMVQVTLLFAKLELPLAIIIGIVFFIGFFTALVFRSKKEDVE